MIFVCAWSVALFFIYSDNALPSVWVGTEEVSRKWGIDRIRLLLMEKPFADHHYSNPLW
jgi:hypothetical protein